MWRASNAVRRPANFLPPAWLDPEPVSSQHWPGVPPTPSLRLGSVAQGLLLALALAACRSDRSDQAVAAPGDASVRLVVLIVVDQLPSWSFDAALPSLEGGLARLVERGVHFTRAELPFAGTFTASGHASLATGAPPSVHGIVANDWHRATGERSLGATVDPGDMTLQSSRQLRVDGVADVLERQTAGKSRTVSLALKDRSAILAIGRRPDLAIWYDPAHAAMTTSRFYTAKPPSWLRELASDRPASRFFRSEWRPIAQRLVVRLAGGADDQAGELGNDGFDASFPHSLAEVPDPAKAIINTPFGTDVLFDAAEAALRGEAMGIDEVPDLLAISVSSHDHAGHGWGQESWERVDVMLRLDQRLAAFLDHLDRTVGAGKVAVVLTSDHGATRLIERVQSAGGDAVRIEKPVVRQAAERAAKKALGVGPWVRGISGNMIHVTRAFSDQPRAQRDIAIRDMVVAVRAIPGMGLVAPTADLAGDCARHREPVWRMACLSLPEGPLGPILLLARDGSHIAGDHPWGASHGGASADERTVPVIIAAPGHSRARRDQTVSLLSIAPTLSALLGVAAPPAARAPPLTL